MDECINMVACLNQGAALCVSPLSSGPLVQLHSLLLGILLGSLLLGLVTLQGREEGGRGEIVVGSEADWK